MQKSLMSRLRPAIKRLGEQSTSQALILMYHCVAERDYDPWKMCVRESNFAEQLQVVHEMAYPMGLSELTLRHAEGKLPDHAVVLTFDDGYVDNLYTAKPLLERYAVPATVFVSSGSINKECGFWWDELARLIMDSEALPNTLALDVKGRTFQWKRAHATHDVRGRSRAVIDWLLGRQKDDDCRQSLYFSLHRFLQPMLETEQLHALEQLRAWTGAKPQSPPSYPSLSQEELCALSQGELVEIGAHTVTHAFLSAHSAQRQLTELGQCKSALEDMVGQAVRSFAYPYGNYSRQTISLVQEVGYDCACSIINDSVWLDSDRYRFPRAGVKNWNGETFAKWLSQVFTHATAT